MGRIHITIQSRKSFLAERYDRLKFVWWIFSSILFTSLFYFFVESFSDLWWIFVGFMALFMFADLTKSRKTKAYAHVFLGLLYFIWGVLFLIFTVKYLGTTDERVVGFILTGSFLMIAYKKIKRYTNLFYVLFGPKNNSRSGQKNRSRNNFRRRF
jgi:hypothetical protein